MKTCIYISLSALILQSCTISMQNISTHGTATDLVDENQSPSTDLKTTLQVPLK